EAECLCDAHRLASELDGKTPHCRVLIALRTGQTRDCRHAVAHTVLRELRPAFAPQIRGRFDAVDHREHRYQFFDALRDYAVHFADAENGVLVPAFRRGAPDARRVVHLDRDHRSDDAQGLAPTDDRGNLLFVNTIL